MPDDRGIELALRHLVASTSLYSVVSGLVVVCHAKASERDRYGDCRGRDKWKAAASWLEDAAQSRSVQDAR